MLRSLLQPQCRPRRRQLRLALAAQLTPDLHDPEGLLESRLGSSTDGRSFCNAACSGASSTKENGRLPSATACSIFCSKSFCSFAVSGMSFSGVGISLRIIRRCFQHYGLISCKNSNSICQHQHAHTVLGILTTSRPTSPGLAAACASRAAAAAAFAAAAGVAAGQLSLAAVVFLGSVEAVSGSAETSAHVLRLGSALVRKMPEQVLLAVQARPVHQRQAGVEPLTALCTRPTT